MPDDEQQIRTLILQWAEAVHRGDMEATLADHDADIVMFDVPPPHDGVRGIDASRETWPGFFAWQAQGAVFEIVTLEVTAGESVAFAHGLLRCATPQQLAAHPEARLRLTIGLRKAGRPLARHTRASLVRRYVGLSVRGHGRNSVAGAAEAAGAVTADATTAGG